MGSLFLRIFVLFWIAMALIVAGSIAITFTMAARVYESAEQQHRPNVAIEASQVLSQGGIAALRDWLDLHKNSLTDRDFYIVGPDGNDILGRRLTAGAARRMEFLAARQSTAPAPGNFRPPRFAPQIIAADGSAFTVLTVLRHPGIFGALGLPGISLTILWIALAVSACASGWLARHFSAPIRRIQAGARALTAEALDAGTEEPRVSAGLEGRSDDLAVLARDFDAMADKLRANRAAMTQLLRDISHELRSPLARMRVAVGLARQPTPDLSRQLDRLELEIERLDALISQVLKLARLHGTAVAFDRQTIDLDELIEEVVRDANFEGAVKGCSVVVTGTGIDAAHAALRGNRELLSSAIENVLRNAVRYSPMDAPVDVRLEPQADGAAVCIVVRDHGPGVPPGDLKRIFEPFYRVAESRDRHTGGEGIGLAITSQVMKTHGGSATASTLADGGFEVRLTLPRD